MTSRRRFAVCAGIYIAIAVAYSWPLVIHLGNGVAHDYGDPILNTWILWWSGTQAVPLSASWWNPPSFFPATGVLAFSEHLLGQAPIAAPLIAVFHSPLLGYNVTLLSTFVLSAVSAHALAFTLTRRHDASFVAALAFAFAPYRVAQVPHIQVLSSFAAPLCLAALHRFHESGRARWAVLAASAWLLQALMCGYYFFFLSVLLALWIAWFAALRWPVRRFALLAIPFGIALLIDLPFLLGYQHILRDTYGMHRGLEEIQSFSADAAGLLSASDDLLAWGWLHAIRKAESELFPGLTIVVLAIFAIANRRPLATGEDPRWLRVTRQVLLGTAVLLTIATVVPAVYGTWRLRIGGVRVLSIARADKPLTLLMFALLAWSATLPRVRAAIHQRSPTVFYSFAAFAMWVFALGPDPEIFGARLIYQAPYGWLMRMPGFDGLRVPARFWMMALVCLSAIAALAIRRLDGRARRIVVAAAAAGLLIDGWPKPFTVLPAPALHPSPPGVVTRVELPMDDGRDALALYQQMFDRVPLYNGYSGYGAPHQYALREMLNGRDARIYAALTRRGPMAVILDHEADGVRELRAFLAAYPGATVEHDEASWSSYRIPASNAPEPPDVAGSPLRIASVDAIPSGPHAGRAIDGDLSTRWSGGVQRTFAEYSIQLAEPSHVSQVAILLGEFMTDFPQKLRIEVSPDGRAWDTVFFDDTILQAYYGAVRHPREIPLVFAIDRDGVRFVRLRQAGWGTHDWSIAEISVRR